MSVVSTDRRVRKTRKQLRDSLVALILDRGWDSVSIIDVCEHADIGRSTFYVHFADKEDLLLSGFDELHEGLQSTRVKAVGTFRFVDTLLEHAKENTRLMRAVAGRKSGQAVQRRFRDVVNQLVEAELIALKVNSSVRHHLVRYIGGALAELLFDWLEAPKGTDVAALATMFRTLTSHVLEARLTKS